MQRVKKISGKKCVKILCNNFGFSIARQKGSHVVLIKAKKDTKLGTVVPLHKEIKIGTLKSLLDLAKVDIEEFSSFT